MARGLWAGMVRGTCQVCGLDTEGGRFYCDDHADPDDRPEQTEWAHPRPDDVGEGAASVGIDGAAPTTPPPSRERPPTNRKRSWKDRARSWWRAEGAAKPKPAKARGKVPRVPLAGDLTAGYGWIGARLEHTVHYPAGRMMIAQAPAAGVTLDRALEGTLVDRAVVQPLWRTKETWNEIGGIVGPPVLLIVMQNLRVQIERDLEAGDVEAARANQMRFGFLSEGLAMLLRPSLLSLTEAMQEAAARRAEEDERIRAAFGDHLGDGDPVQAMIASLFAPPEWAQPSQEAADNGRAQDPHPTGGDAPSIQGVA